MNSIWGSLGGNIFGTIYFLYFQIIGVLLTCFLLKDKDWITRILCGSVLGSVLLQWIPAVLAFFFNFSRTAHILAACLCGIIVAGLFLLKIPHVSFSRPQHDKITTLIKKHYIFFILFTVTFIVFCCMLSSHTLLVKEDGLHTGQCTFGDINLHLSIITNLAKMQQFPPNYSISPTDKLCYPFLCDSISSSIYIWGASLRYAYILPMLFAIAQAMTGFYCIAYSWLKRTASASLAWFFYFYNGGLGFVYFLDWAYERNYQFKNIFTEYYQTPTNLINNNIRWVNVIVDMLLPQRSTLFGFAVLFTCIWLLWRCAFNHEKDLFPFTALLIGALPMIHTHSFIAIAFISAAWLLMYLYHSVSRPKLIKFPGMIILICFFTFMSIIDILNGNYNNNIDSSRLFTTCLIVIGLIFCYGIWLLFQYVHVCGIKELLFTWGLYLLIILVLALPQLFYWTFSRATNGSFIFGHFNWANQGDYYLWFYIKNWGIILLLLIPAVWYCKIKDFSIISAGFLIWFVTELIAFSPNTYDNNKFLYVAYVFFCCISAQYGYELYLRLKKVHGVKMWCYLFVFLSSISALLSMGRELVSDYTLYSTSHVEACLFIEENTPVTATILTDSRHFNDVPALTGRYIVNGSSLFLSTHGIYSEERTADVQSMYESPESSAELFTKYHVNYIMISSWERSNYNISEETFDKLFECIYHGNNDEIKIYKTNL